LAELADRLQCALLRLASGVGRGGDDLRDLLEREGAPRVRGRDLARRRHADLRGLGAGLGRREGERGD
jgi:hypothetical protein